MTSPAAGNRPVTGVVLWYKAQKGYGFVKPDDGGADVFVHAVELAASGLKELQEGDRISFHRDSHGDGRFYAVEISYLGARL